MSQVVRPPQQVSPSRPQVTQLTSRLGRASQELAPRQRGQVQQQPPQAALSRPQVERVAQVAQVVRGLRSQPQQAGPQTGAQQPLEGLAQAVPRVAHLS